MHLSENEYAILQQKREVSEREFQRRLKALASKSGWLYYHTANSKRSEPGFPDTVLVKGSTVLFAELKTSSGRLGPAQLVWGDALHKVVRVEYHVWTPDDQQAISERLFRRE